MRAAFLGLLAACCAAPVGAQTLSSIEIASDRVAAGELVSLRIEFQPFTGSARCALQINYGDGDEGDMPVDKLPVVLERRYAQPATYVITVKGKRRMRGVLDIKPACDGPVLTKTLTVFDRAAEEAEQRRKDELLEREAALKEERARLLRERRALEAAQTKASEAAAAARLAATKTPQSGAPRPAVAASAIGVAPPR